MLRMKEVYAVLDRHIRYAATKAFFGTKMAEGSSVQSHGVKMLSLVEKLEDLKAGLDNDTYIDFIHELINMLVQYEATTHKSEPAVLVGEASTSKAKGKGARRWKRKKGKGTAVTATASTEGAPPAAPTGKGKGKVWVLSGRGQMMCAFIVMERALEEGVSTTPLPPNCGAHICNDLQVLQRSRKLSKDEMILRLGDGKAVAAEAVGSLSLVVSDHVRIDLKDYFFVPSMVKNIISIPMLDSDDMACKAGHISKDRIRRLVDSKSLEIDDLDHLPTCESCLKGKMTKKPFVGQSAIANDLLDLVHTDVCGPLSIPARGGFFYFITFTDDNSRYGYVYLMRYKSEAFGRFKEYRLEVENQTNRKIKVLQSDRGGEYLSGEFIDYLKENGILSQWTPPGTPQLNGVAERRNRTLLDMSVPQTPYEIWHGKPASYKYLRVWGSLAYVKRLVGDKLDSNLVCAGLSDIQKKLRDTIFIIRSRKRFLSQEMQVFLEKEFPSDNRRDEVFIEESSGEPQLDSPTSFDPTVHTDSVPVLHRSTRESRVPERYGFVG
ncbi:UNVERIFIED_CONTAM: hypothetical protein Slati_2768500 [Sesamum latifolium]|uniref:Integrase catalytic domain-containing protein n=1 Tax=Sesamum latifolium TaxID=2727402 RepID=A0AAW2W228_9LAMI